MLEQFFNALKPVLRPAVREWRQRFSSTKLPIEPFLGFSEQLRDKMICATTMHFYRPAEHRSISGAITPNERKMLYALGRLLEGPIMEVGAWLGLSTTAIARGIKDSGCEKSFDTYDLRITEAMMREVGDGMVGLFVPGDDVPHGACSKERYESNILPFIRTPGGTEPILKNNLARLGLAQFVRIHYQDFNTVEPYRCGFMFCDAVHDRHELKINVPHLKRFLASGSIVACHDIGHLSELTSAFRLIIPLRHSTTVDSLYIGEVA
jgi:Methyltransferase domain